MSKLIVSNKQLPTIKEGIIKGLEIASGAKSSATYYHKKTDQIAAVRNAVRNLYGISKELPLILASQKGVTGFFIQETLLNDFKNGEKGGACNIINPQNWYDDNIGQNITENLLYVLEAEHGITYVLRMLESFKEHGINNQRSRKIAIRFIFTRDNLEFLSVKYRNKIKNILTHVYGQKKSFFLTNIIKKYLATGIFNDDSHHKIINKELLKYGNDSEKLMKLYLFIMGEGAMSYYDDGNYPVINQFFKAHSDITGCSILPAEVLEGLISNVEHPQNKSMWGTESLRKNTQKMIRESNQAITANQSVRQTKKNRELGVNKDINLSKVSDFVALYKTGYEAGFTPELTEAISELALKRKLSNFMYDNIGIVLDNSLSMSGHKQESKNTPRAIAEFTAEVLKHSAKANNIRVTSNKYATDLASAFLDLANEGNYDVIFIISDGYENMYDGLLDEVVSYWKTLDNNDNIPLYHVSPITGAEMNAKVRKLSDKISTLAVNKPESVMLQLSSKLLEQDVKAWLKSQINMLAKPSRTKINRIQELTN